MLPQKGEKRETRLHIPDRMPRLSKSDTIGKINKVGHKKYQPRKS